MRIDSKRIVWFVGRNLVDLHCYSLCHWDSVRWISLPMKDQRRGRRQSWLFCKHPIVELSIWMAIWRMREQHHSFRLGRGLVDLDELPSWIEALIEECGWNNVRCNLTLFLTVCIITHNRWHCRCQHQQVSSIFKRIILCSPGPFIPRIYNSTNFWTEHIVWTTWWRQ